MSKTLIIVPTYEEVANIQPLAALIFQHLPKAELLFVDDHSLDGTQEEIQSLALQTPQVHLLSRAKKLGLGTAYLAGFAWALKRDYDHVIEMDADFSHDPRYLPTMVELLNTHPLVIGSRYIEGGGTSHWHWLRRRISRFGSWYARFFLRSSLRDLTGGFNGWHTTLLHQLNLPTIKSDGYVFQIELKYRAQLLGVKATEFPIVFEDRRAGQSKMSMRIVIEALWKVLTLALFPPKLK
jgi:dolichol-phosphate mannosyltransferase